MSNSLPFPTPEGLPSLRLLRPLEEWDHVLLAAFTDADQLLYLGVQIAEGADQDAWLLSELAPLTMIEVLDGSIDYSRAFRSAVANYKVTVIVAEKVSNMQRIDDVPEDWLPMPDLRRSAVDPLLHQSQP